MSDLGRMMMDQWRQCADPRMFYSLPVQYSKKFLKIADMLGPIQSKKRPLDVDQQALETAPADADADAMQLQLQNTAEVRLDSQEAQDVAWLQF